MHNIKSSPLACHSVVTMALKFLEVDFIGGGLPAISIELTVI